MLLKIYLVVDEHPQRSLQGALGLDGDIALVCDYSNYKGKRPLEVISLYFTKSIATVQPGKNWLLTFDK